MEMTRFVSGKLVNFSVKSSFYYFNKKVYEQVEGLGMGLPLSPTFSNIFMEENLEKLDLAVQKMITRGHNVSAFKQRFD